MRKVAIPVAILALISLDQWVKHWVVANISLNQVIKAIPGVFSLTYLQTVSYTHLTLPTKLEV